MNLFKKMVMHFTFQEREKRDYERYEIRRRALESLSSRELHAKYIKLKSSYEIKKGFYPFFIGMLCFFILMGIGKGVYQNFFKILNLCINQEIPLEVTKVILVISMFILVTFVIVMFGCIILCLKNSYREYEQLMLIEEVRTEKSKNS